ncbi:MAG: PHP domain-containing protein [Verrucomicrobiales bacterium]|jgi:predicted metal-dependent phosphoesterase TrpH|nr:PHP domain-containing protein [Verrucomicrobiales bacterium]
MAGPLRLKFDLHCHSRFSADGIAAPEDMVARARELGLGGFAITDHNTCACVDYFLDQGLMNASGEPVDGLLIIPGQEISTADGHLLALGARLPNVKGIASADAVRLIHEQGGLAVPAHPFDYFRSGIRQRVLDTLADLDALEVFNAATTWKSCNRQARDYAAARHLPMTAGSDAHHHQAVGRACTILEPERFNLASVLAAIKHPVGREERYITKKDAVLKTWHLLLMKIKRGGGRV